MWYKALKMREEEEENKKVEIRLSYFIINYYDFC